MANKKNIKPKNLKTAVTNIALRLAPPHLTAVFLTLTKSAKILIKINIQMMSSASSVRLKDQRYLRILKKLRKC